jgi:D-alanyl-D-alanine carboxypeptidase
MIKVFGSFIFFLTSLAAYSQKSSLACKIDSVLGIACATPFNGVVMVEKNDSIQYSKMVGYSDIAKSTGFKKDDRFVIGSISKQFAAVLTLQEYEMGRLKLDVPISAYLPNLKMTWKDSVTVHQLLTHTHGITEIDQELTFVPGTNFQYSQIGYDLLAKIIEKSAGKSFQRCSMEMFEKCQMENTFHPEVPKDKRVVNGYTEENGKLISETKSFQNFPAAGSFISTAEDLIKWNHCFFGGKLLKEETMNLLTTKHKGAVRDHPIFGRTEYGYGITITNEQEVLQYGQTGFSPGFISMNYYFPDGKTTVIVLQNIVYSPDDLKKMFRYHIQILDLLRTSLIAN